MLAIRGRAGTRGGAAGAVSFMAMGGRAGRGRAAGGAPAARGLATKRGSARATGRRRGSAPEVAETAIAGASAGGPRASRGGGAAGVGGAEGLVEGPSALGGPGGSAGPRPLASAGGSAPLGPSDAAVASPAPPSRRSSASKRSSAPAGLTASVERSSWARGLTRVVGVDEAGRGPLAGPVVAAAYCHPPGAEVVPGIRDSKLMTEEQREEAYERLTRVPGAAWATCARSAAQVDAENVLQAAMAAMSGAVRSLGGRPELVLVDGNRVPEGIAAWVERVARAEREAAAREGGRGEQGGEEEGGEGGKRGEGEQGGEGEGGEGHWGEGGEGKGGEEHRAQGHEGEEGEEHRAQGHGGVTGRMLPLSPPSAVLPSVRCIVKGDGKVYSIAAASVIAKVTRDRYMLRLDAEHPAYGFAQHKGYGVPAHMRALAKHGPCPEHRVTYAPVRRALEARERAQKASARKIERPDENKESLPAQGAENAPSNAQETAKAVSEARKRTENEEEKGARTLETRKRKGRGRAAEGPAKGRHGAEAGGRPAAPAAAEKRVLRPRRAAGGVAKQ